MRGQKIRMVFQTERQVGYMEYVTDFKTVDCTVDLPDTVDGYALTGVELLESEAEE